MPYSTIAKMEQSQSLRDRLVGCAAQEGIPDPRGWVQQRLLDFLSDQGWMDAWQYAEDTWTPDDNPDTGARPGVISDAMILSAVQALSAA